MSVLHIVPLPGIEPGLYRGFSLILELDQTDQNPPSDETVANWKAFAEDSGARGLIITDRNLVILGPPSDGPTVEPGPCPSYMEGLGVTHLCGLRHLHSGLHEEIKPGDGANPPTIATWGERERWEASAAGGFQSIAAPDRRIDLSKVDLSKVDTSRFEGWVADNIGTKVERSTS